MLIFGTGEFAEVAHFYFEQSGKKVTAFTVDEPQGDFCGKPVVAWKEARPDEIYIAVGYRGQNSARAILLSQAKAGGFTPVSFVSSAAICLSRDIGEHVFILEGNVIQCFAGIGDNSVLWSGNHIGHGSKVSRNCFLSSHVVLSGGVTVGLNTFIGVNSSVADHVKIGDRNIILMGSRVTSDTPENCVWNVDGPSKVPANRLKL